MLNTFKISESLQFFFENKQQESAINQIIESKNIPRNLSWKEIEQYNIAKVSALTTQLDYWLLMKELWDATWGKALVSSVYKEVDSEYYDKEYSTEYVWNERFYKAYIFKENLIHFACYAVDESVCLIFYVGSPNEQYDISNNMDLSDQWTKPEDNERSTHERIIDIKGKTEIDVEPLTNLANEVVTKLNEQV
jgi:hypothetical protein